MKNILSWLKSFWKPAREKQSIFDEMAKAILLSEYYKSPEYEQRFQRLYDKIKDNGMNENELYQEYNKLKNDFIEIKTDINWLKWIIPILVTVGIFVTNIVVASIKTEIKAIDAKFDTKMEANQQEIFNEIKLLRNDFQHQKELNKIEIEKEVLRQTRK